MFETEQRYPVSLPVFKNLSPPIQTLEDQWLRGFVDALDPRRTAPAGVGGPWPAWLASNFPSYTTYPPAPHHAQAWDWVWEIQRGVRPPPFVLILARGGAKSTTAELGTVGVAAKKSRRYALYVSETQVQADKHVQSVAGMMERAGFERELNKYGSSKGWRRNQIRTSDGFKVDAIGLDTAARGFKIDEDRPDFIVLDDLDGKHDTPQTTQRKIEALTMTILPAMATDGAVFAVQNIIHGNGIFARLSDTRADFLADRIVSGPHPAIIGMDYEYRDGRYIITAGVPTWEGQSIAACQGFINTWGLLAFLVECQHDVARAGRYYETWRDEIHICQPFPIPGDTPIWAAFDHGFAHNTAFGVFTMMDGDVFLIGEHVQNKWTVRDHVNAMDGLLARLRIHKSRIRLIAAGHDVFQQRGDDMGETIADKYARLGYRFEPATIDRINGWTAIRERLGNPSVGHRPTFYVFDTCSRTAQALRELTHDPKRPEDVLKVDADQDGNGGDDCFIAGTQITTKRGAISIENTRIGDYVLTRGGWRPIKAIGLNRINSHVITLQTTSGTLTGTPNHPIYVRNRGFIPLDMLRYGDIIVTGNELLSSEVQPWQNQKQSNLTVSNFVDTPNQRFAPTKSIIDLVETTASEVWERCMWKYGSRFTAKYPRDGMFTMPTGIRSTMTLTIWCYSLLQSMAGCMGLNQIERREVARILTPYVHWQAPGMALTMVARGIASYPSGHGNNASQRPIYVNSAVLNTIQWLLEGIAFALTPVSQSIDGHKVSIMNSAHVRRVERYSPATITTNNNAVPVRVLGLSDAGRVDTFAIHVAGHHEYVANGILVKNCADMLRYGLMAIKPIDIPEDDEEETRVRVSAF